MRGCGPTLAALLERITLAVGRIVSWLTLVVVLATFVVVVLRYFFALGYIWLQEVSVYLHALVFLLGAAYTLAHDGHVRVDIFYRRLSDAGRRRVDVLGVVFFLLPTNLFFMWLSWDYVARSWLEREASRQTGGLPYPFVPLLKTSILLACVLLVMQGVAWLLRGGAINASPAGGTTTNPTSKL